MSIRDGLEPSRSPDAETQTHPLPDGEAAPADATWPPSWGQAPARPDTAQTQPPAPEAGPAWSQPAAAAGPSWTQAKGPDTQADTPAHPAHAPTPVPTPVERARTRPSFGPPPE